MKSVQSLLILASILCSGCSPAKPSLPFVVKAPSIATPWYGPVIVDFDFKTTGNPYDPAANDVRVSFKSASNQEERIAYFAHGKWHAVFMTQTPGTYQATILQNGKTILGIGSNSVPLANVTAVNLPAPPQ